MNNKIIRIADITLSLIFHNIEIVKFYEDNAYHSFKIPSANQPSMNLHIFYDQVSTDSLDEKLYEIEKLHRIYRSSDETFVMLIQRSFFLQFAILEPSIRSGYIYIKFLKHFTAYIPDPLKMLMANIISYYGGVMVHACGIIVNNLGIIFIGDSGSGKSTLANLWKNVYPNSILSDECIIIRKIKNQFYVFGTPWHSNVIEVNNGSIPLRGIFFISHAKNNHITPRNDINSIIDLLCSNSHITILDESEIKHRLQFFGELINEIPCYELGFVPNEEVIGFIEKAIK